MSHWIVVKPILRYLEQCTKIGPKIGKSNSLLVSGISNLISWSPRKHRQMMSRSSKEAKYKAIANTTAGIIWRALAAARPSHWRDYPLLPSFLRLDYPCHVRAPMDPAFARKTMLLSAAERTVGWTR